MRRLQCNKKITVQWEDYNAIRRLQCNKKITMQQEYRREHIAGCDTRPNASPRPRGQHIGGIYTKLWMSGKRLFSIPTKRALFVEIGRELSSRESIPTKKSAFRVDSRKWIIFIHSITKKKCVCVYKCTRNHAEFRGHVNWERESFKKKTEKKR